MLSRIEGLFDPERPRSGGLLGLVVSDYLAYYGSPTAMRLEWSVWGSKKAASPRRLALLFLPRLVSNPCLHATSLLRLALASPRWMLGLWRTILIAKHSIDIQRQIELGPGLLFPHPLGIVFGNGVRIGADVTILNNVILGGNPGRAGNLRDPEPGAQLCPDLGDDVVIFGRATLVGGIKVGDRSVVGAGAWVDGDVESDTVQPGLAALYRDHSRRRGARVGSQVD